MACACDRFGLRHGYVDSRGHALFGFYQHQVLVGHRRLNKAVVNKRQTCLFVTISTAGAVVLFMGMALDSHHQFGKLTNADKVAPGVSRGDGVWCANNRINCHAVICEATYYAASACA